MCRTERGCESFDVHSRARRWLTLAARINESSAGTIRSNIIIVSSLVADDCLVCFLSLRTRSTMTSRRAAPSLLVCSDRQSPWPPGNRSNKAEASDSKSSFETSLGRTSWSGFRLGRASRRRRCRRGLSLVAGDGRSCRDRVIDHSTTAWPLINFSYGRHYFDCLVALDERIDASGAHRGPDELLNHGHGNGAWSCLRRLAPKSCTWLSAAEPRAKVGVGQSPSAHGHVAERAADAQTLRDWASARPAVKLIGNASAATAWKNSSSSP